VNITVKVWSPVEPPAKLGIHSTNVAVDWDVCVGDGVCADVYPVALMIWSIRPIIPWPIEKLILPKKNGIQCIACQLQSPAATIKITTF